MNGKATISPAPKPSSPSSRAERGVGRHSRPLAPAPVTSAPIDIEAGTKRSNSKRRGLKCLGAAALLATVGGGTGAYFALRNRHSQRAVGPAGPNAASVPNLSIEPWPHVGFGNYQQPLIQRAVALTFDDGPAPADASNNATEKLLDILSHKKLPATFFVCNNLWTNVTGNAAAQQTLRRIVRDGHSLGSHTLDHKDLSLLDSAAIHAEFADNEAVLRQVFGKSYQSTLLRAPFGKPYQTNSANVSQVASVQMPFGVHIGWGIDADDWKCAQNGKGVSCILGNIEAQLQRNQSGPILMHAVYDLTVQALPQVLDLISKYNRSIVSVEDLVKEKYQSNSAQVMSSWAARHYDADLVGTTAVQDSASNAAIAVPY